MSKLFSIISKEYGITEDIIMIKCSNKNQIGDYIKNNVKDLLKIIIILCAHVCSNIEGGRKNIYFKIIKKAVNKYYPDIDCGGDDDTEDDLEEFSELLLDENIHNNNKFVNYIRKEISKQPNKILIDDLDYGEHIDDGVESSVKLLSYNTSNCKFITL
jgi:hypothetical protein